jgi:hypothetical protein
VKSSDIKPWYRAVELDEACKASITSRTSPTPATKSPTEKPNGTVIVFGSSETRDT